MRLFVSLPIEPKSFPEMGYVSRQQPGELRRSSGKLTSFGKIDIELTERCNNNCVHCYINLPAGDVAAATREMETGFVREILRQAADLGFLTVRFTGGEPTLRSDFADLYLYARRLGMQVNLYTNARLITPDLAALMVRYPPGGVVEISVYGMSATTYDRIARCPGAFEEFRRGVDLLAANKVPFIIKGPKLPFLREEQAAFEAWASTLPAMDRMPAYSMNFDLRARRDDPGKNKSIDNLRVTPEETVAMLSREPDYFAEMARFCSAFLGPPGDKLFHCGAGHSLCIDAYGRAQACLPLRHPDFSVDLHESTLRSAIEERFPALLDARATNPEYLRRCANCFLKSLCDQCPAKSWAEHGTLDTPVEYLCEVTHAQARQLGLLHESEHGWEVVEWKERVERFVNIHQR